MKAYRLIPTDEERGVELPPPELRRSPLAEPGALSEEGRLPDCWKCEDFRECWQRQVANYHDKSRFRPFVRPECEMMLREGSTVRHDQPRPHEKSKTADTVLTIIRALQPCTTEQIMAATGLPMTTVRGHLSNMTRHGELKVVGVIYHKGAKSGVQVYEVAAATGE